MAEKVPTAAILTIGDELLRGDTVDANKAFLGAELSTRGVAVVLAVTIPDDSERIVHWVKRLAVGHDHVIICGGIGPTPDDLTRQAVALAFNRELVLHERELRDFEQQHGFSFNPGQHGMWRLPRDSELIFGKGVYCPGFRLENVYVFAGVPEIMQAMWNEVSGRFQGKPVHTVRFHAGVGESHWADVMARFVGDHPELKFGSYPRLGERWYAEVMVSGCERDIVECVAAELEREIQRIANRHATGG